MKLDLEKEVSVSIKIEDRDHESYGKTIHVTATLDELLYDGLPQVLIDKEIFESMGHPCDSYTLNYIVYEF